VLVDYSDKRRFGHPVWLFRRAQFPNGQTHVDGGHNKVFFVSPAISFFCYIIFKLSVNYLPYHKCRCIMILKDNFRFSRNIALVAAKSKRNFVDLNVAVLRRGHDELVLGSKPVFVVDVS
jgi:hypothetical protein